MLHFEYEMRNAESDGIAAVCEHTGVHINTGTCKGCPFPPEIVSRGRELLRPFDLTLAKQE